jgi:hypothetical protein
MRWVFALLTIEMVVSCRRPLGPGQSRCVTTTNVFGQLETNCESGQSQSPDYPNYSSTAAAPPPVQVRGWWCSSRSDGVTSCSRYFAQCDAWKSGGTTRRDGLMYYDCQPVDLAFCATSGCASSLSACAMLEKIAGRDGSVCTAVP